VRAGRGAVGRGARPQKRLSAARPGSIAITASLGVACAQGAGLVVDDLFRAADQAL
jgi:PleD family two-component response regulator